MKWPAKCHKIELAVKLSEDGSFIYRIIKFEYSQKQNYLTFLSTALKLTKTKIISYSILAPN